MAKKSQSSWPPRGFTCGDCGFSTALISDLLEHMRTEHGQDAA